MAGGEERSGGEPPLQTQADELEQGIFNMVITLTQFYAGHVPLHEAKEIVASWLERIVNGLRTTTDEEGTKHG